MAAVDGEILSHKSERERGRRGWRFSEKWDRVERRGKTTGRTKRNEWMDANTTTCGSTLIFIGDCNLVRTEDCIRQSNLGTISVSPNPKLQISHVLLSYDALFILKSHYSFIFNPYLFYLNITYFIGSFFFSFTIRVYLFTLTAGR